MRQTKFLEMLNGLSHTRTHTHTHTEAFTHISMCACEARKDIMDGSLPSQVYITPCRSLAITKRFSKERCLVSYPLQGRNT